MCNGITGRVPRKVIVASLALASSWCDAQADLNWDIPCQEDHQFPSYEPRPQQPTDHYFVAYRRSIFRVELSQNGAYTFEGNATLISEGGYFLTAAHVISVLPQSSLWLSRPADADSAKLDRYPAEIVFQGKPSSTPGNDALDIALLHVKNWKDPTKHAVPLRYTGSLFNSGNFISFPDDTMAVTNYTVTMATGNPSDPMGAFHGTAFYGRSGSLVVDQYGLGQGVVAAYNNYAEDAVQSIGGMLKYAQYLDLADRFGAAVISPGASWLGMIPIDDTLGVIVTHCKAKSVTQDDLRMLRESYDDLPLNAIDTLYVNCGHQPVGNASLSAMLKIFLINGMQTHCAALRDLATISPYTDMTPAQSAEIGRAALTSYLNRSPGADHVTLGNDQPPAIATTISTEMLDRVRTLPPSAALTHAYLALNSATTRQGHDPWLLIDVAKAQYELALQTGIIKDSTNNQAVSSIVNTLAAARAAGAKFEHVRGVANLIAIQQRDWTSGAALAATQVTEWQASGDVPAPKAQALINDSAYFAHKAAGEQNDSQWTQAWKAAVSNQHNSAEKLKVFSRTRPTLGSSSTFAPLVSPTVAGR